MGKLIEMFFKPPPFPEITFPMAAKLIPGIKITVAKAFEMAYYRGVYDGFIGGVLVTLLFVPSIRSRVIKGASNVIDHL
jgi:hypothetical protein